MYDLIWLLTARSKSGPGTRSYKHIVAYVCRHPPLDQLVDAVGLAWKRKKRVGKEVSESEARLCQLERPWFCRGRYCRRCVSLSSRQGGRAASGMVACKGGHGWFPPEQPFPAGGNRLRARQSKKGTGQGQKEGRTTRAVATTLCKLSLVGPAECGVHLHPTGRHSRLGRWSTLWVWSGGCFWCRWSTLGLTLQHTPHRPIKRPHATTTGPLTPMEDHAYIFVSMRSNKCVSYISQATE